jgi:hypothetical protein
MINIASKAGNYLKATSQVVASGLRPLVAGSPKQQNVVVDKQELTTVDSLIKALPQCGNLRVRSGVPGNLSIHNFIRF